MDLTYDNYSSSCYYNTFGQISELFSSPVIPKMVIVGLTDELINSFGFETHNLKLFKEILSKTLENLFTVEYLEQFIPKYEKLPNNLTNYRNHEVKESWMYKIRSECPSILIDFRIMSMYDIDGMPEGYGDEVLIDQILQTKNSLSAINGPVYLIWLSGSGITNQRSARIASGAGIEKSAISLINLVLDAQMLANNLKPRIQECYEFSRQFYQNLSKKYKKSIGVSEKIQKFMQPWMSPVYYYFKLAVLEEFSGDFTASLKYYHTILAKFKELIESNEEVDWKCEMTNYLRNFADICFIRLSFLLFRLDQCKEAEFGLFRYFKYFGRGLNANKDKFLWKYNMSRQFAILLGMSNIWLPKNAHLLRGPSNFIIFAVKMAKEYLKVSEDNFYQIQDMIINDLYSALEYSSGNDQLSYITKYIQFLLSVETETLISNDICTNWKLLDNRLLDISINQYTVNQMYYDALNAELKRGINDFNIFEDWCMFVSELDNSKKLSLNAKDLIFCCVRFKRTKCSVFENCGIEFSIDSKLPFVLESVCVCVNSEYIDFPYSSSNSNLHEFMPKKIGSYKIRGLKLNFSRPSMIVDIDENCLQHQQNSEKNYDKMSLEFSRICQQTSRLKLQLIVDPLKPKISVTTLDLPEVVLKNSTIELNLKIRNEMDLPIICTLDYGESINISSRETKIISIKYKVKNEIFHVKIKSKFNLELIDLQYVEHCSFDPIEDLLVQKIRIVDPFKIILFKDQDLLVIDAKEDIEWISWNISESDELELPCVIMSGCYKAFKFSGENIKGDFRLLNDKSKRIFQHEWTI